MINGTLNKDAPRLIKRLGLENHPEGGYFKQPYTANTIVNLGGIMGPGMFQQRSITC
ncbi:MAG TPA: cupin domain-containing protein [Nitrososphaera sp.]|nr:cupin domain-containing protein [Nitrososphaera sp.]